MDRSGGYCVTLVYPIPLLPSGPGGFFGLQLRSPPDLCSQAVYRLKRREWDSNPRWSYPHTRFPSVLLKPLGHLSMSTLSRARGTFGLYHIDQNRAITICRGSRLLRTSRSSSVSFRLSI